MISTGRDSLHRVEPVLRRCAFKRRGCAAVLRTMTIKPRHRWRAAPASRRARMDAQIARR